MRLQNESFDFLTELKTNNNREWFEAHKDVFNYAQEGFIAFVETLLQQLAPYDTTLTSLTARECVFRLNRDTRFSKDKTPYKINFGAHLIAGGKNSGRAGYYFYFQPGGASYIGGGIHLPSAAALSLIRKEISSNSGPFLKILNDTNFVRLFTLQGEQTATIPKDYDKNDTMGDYLRYKELLFLHPIADTTIAADNFSTYCLEVYQCLMPIISYINTALEK